MARQSRLGSVEDSAPVHLLRRLPSGLDLLHPLARPQVQQDPHHQVHVVPDVPHPPHDPPDAGRHHATLPRRAHYPQPLLVRVDVTRVAVGAAAVRTHQPQ